MATTGADGVTAAREETRDPAAGEVRLDFLELEPAEVGAHPRLLQEIFERRYVGAILRGVFPAELMAEIAARLTAGVEGVPRAYAPTFSGGLYGNPLVLGTEDLSEYLEDAARFRRTVEPLFASVGGLEATIDRSLGAIAGDAPVEVARAEDGRPYLPATFRVLVEGDSLPLHYENGTKRYDSMKELLPALDPESILSFYVPVVLPEAGGVLEVFSTDCGGAGDRAIERMGGPERARDIMAARGLTEVHPGVGDMLVFDGGRHYHLVTRVEDGSRWTLGGFFAFTTDHSRVLYWS